MSATTVVVVVGQKSGQNEAAKQLCLSLRAPASEGHGASRDDHFAMRLWYLMMMMVINSFI